MRRSLFWTLFGPQLAILLGCIAALSAYAWLGHRNAVSREWRHVLETQAALTAHLIQDDSGALRDTAGLQAICERLLRETGLRLTVMRPDGQVLADSEARRETMLRHDDRPEIIAALRDGYGHSARYSTTLRRMLHYVARPLADADGKPQAVVRVAIDRQAIEAPVRRNLRFFFAMLTVLVAASVSLSYLFARRITLPVGRMRVGLRRLGEGVLDYRLTPPSLSHLAALASSINDMGARLETQFHQIETERTLRENILAGMHEGILALDAHRRIVLVNQAARELLGLGARAVDGQTVDLVVPCADLLALVDAAQTAVEPLSDEIQIREAHAPLLLLAGATRWRQADGAPAGTLVILNDLTRLRRLEQIRRDFVANVSHELRTPITSIAGFAETLLDDPPPDAATAKRFLEIIRRQCDQVRTILNDMLLLARLEDSGTALQAETVDAAALIAQACEVCGPRAQAGHVALQQDLADPLRFQGHAHLLEQALVNLIDNAIKYGGPNQTVTVQAAGDDQTVTLTVRDQGPGIDEARAERVFERFYRIDAGRGRGQGGSGLGLALVKHIVNLHGGDVTVRNLPGGGCEFRLSLPRSPHSRSTITPSRQPGF